MGIPRKTKWLWLPALAMLASASVTSKFIESNTRLTDQSSQWKMQQVLSSAAYESCCPYPLPDNTTPAVFQLPPENPDAAPVTKTAIWVRMRAGFNFPAVEPDAVRHYIDEYVKHPHLFEQLLQRGEPYLFHILNRIEQGGMPAELALLPVIESAFDPFATSPAGAAGIWQFMPETADYLGLNQDWWYDGRRDVIASTEAALGYLRQLHKRFDGDWLLALAAYNAGGARVQRAIRHNRDAGKPVDFWHLMLPAETRSYVPKLIALRTIIGNPQDYNISLPHLSDTRYFSTVNIQGQLELKVAARLSGIPLLELQGLNPGYDLSITPPDRMNTLLVPIAVADKFRTHIARLPQDQRVQSIRHRIRLGDNLSTIAQQYRTTVPDIRKVNRLKGNKIIAGDLLIIPVVEHGDSIAASTYTTLM
jgi:membrane-bound lytic murein transglycosylase D